MHLSIIIPAYNEGKRIGGTLEKIFSFMKTKGYDYEVLVVDDGSDDDTVSISEKSALASKKRLKVVKNGTNLGKGFSVKNGIANSSGEYVLFSDADMSTPIEEVDKLFGALSGGYDIAIGSRDVASSAVKLHQPFYRETMGKIFNVLVRRFVIDGLCDTQCGFKLFKGDAARKIAGELKINGFCFDVEMLYIAKKKGYNIKEVGVEWYNSPQSKVSPVRSSFSMFKDLVRIRKLHS